MSSGPKKNNTSIRDDEEVPLKGRNGSGMSVGSTMGHQIGTVAKKIVEGTLQNSTTYSSSEAELCGHKYKELALHGSPGWS